MSKAVVLVVLTLLLLAVGSAGFSLIEGWGLFDSLYMTVITVTTVGFSEIHPFSPAGRAFAIFLIFAGLGIVSYSVTVAGQFIIEGEFRQFLGRGRKLRVLKRMKEHYIVAGYGRMGQVICERLAAEGADFVLIEQDDQCILEAEARGYVVVSGDAAEEETLIDAGVLQAKGLAAALPDDPDNLYLVMTARGLNPKLVIVTKALSETGRTKLVRAGADRIVSPYELGGRRVAHALLRPSVIAFLDLMTTSEKGYRVEEIAVSGGSSLTGKTLAQSGLRREYGVVVLAIQREDGELEQGPGPETTIRGGDVIIVVGETHGTDRLARAAMGG